MKEEQGTESKHHEDDKVAKMRQIVPDETPENQNSDSEMMSFAFDDSCRNDDKALEAKELPENSQCAKLCMVSSVLHMKCLAQRRAKSIRDLRKAPMTTLEERGSSNMKECSKSNDVKLVITEEDSEEEEEIDDCPLSYLKKCRYLRGVEEDKELSPEEIFS